MAEGKLKKSTLRRALDHHFSKEELDVLCSDIQEDLAVAGRDIPVSLEHVGGHAKLVIIRNLIDYFERRDCLDLLIDAARRERPNLNVADFEVHSPEDIRKAYLKDFKAMLEEHAHLYLYTPLSGEANIAQDSQKPLPSATASPLLELLREHTRGLREPVRKRREFGDILEAFADDKVKRVALIGAPGAGKTTSLFKLADKFLCEAEADSQAPLPVFVRLGEWRRTEDDLLSFISGKVGELGRLLPKLVKQKQVVLLLDGLNEIPTAQQKHKASQIEKLPKDGLRMVVSCREQDYIGDLKLELDTLAIRPLSPERIRLFIGNYLRDFHGGKTDKAERLFWTLAGGEEVRETWEAWRKAGAPDLNFFWEVGDIPREKPDIYSQTTGRHDDIWFKKVKDHRSLIRLAGNPFMLRMMVWVYCDTGDLPPNRAGLFDLFIKMLLAREKLATGKPLVFQEDGKKLLQALGELAWQMQHAAIEHEEDNVQVALNCDEVAVLLDDNQLRRAASTSLLDVGDLIRFSHQLLQEYFVALGMRERLEAGTLVAKTLWPHSWERSGWEESTILLAGLYADDCTPIVNWLKDAQPEVAAQCINRSGANTPRIILEQLRTDWLPRLTDIKRESDPRVRAAIGRALGSLELDGYPLDNREGVWGVYVTGDENQPERAEVSIDWVKIPGGEFIYQDGETRRLSTFYISRYPIAHSQFQAFVDDPQGYANNEWWRGLAKRPQTANTSRWSYHNHPRESVTWYEAMAFCRWLSNLRKEDITLPTEEQWERAARGNKGRIYPWGDKYLSGYANITETENKAGKFYLRQTSPVGIYPQGGSVENVLDLSGNVWEWCLNKYDDPEDTSIGGDDGRVVRGGSWLYHRDYARGAFRYRDPLHYVFGHRGFRVCCCAHIFPAPGPWMLHPRERRTSQECPSSFGIAGRLRFASRDRGY